MPALIIWGFIYHYITFKVIPIEDVLFLVLGYLVLGTLTIIFMHFYDRGKISQKLRYIRLFSPLLIQFSIGSMIGGVFIFYWFSGSIFVSWPFIVLVVVLLVSLEIYKHYLEHPVVQFSLYNFSAYLLFAVALPYFLTSISPWLFILAGVISFLLVAALLWVVRNSEVIQTYRNRILFACVLIFMAMNIFYFKNLIPPVPLSIRESGVYHNVYRSGEEYVLETEPRSFWEHLGLIPTIHLTPGSHAYVFTSIYSPTDLDTDIVHDWQHYDESQKKWVSVSKVSFHMIGGRQEGYRGYTYKTNLAPGKWRVYVETPRGQVLGRSQFMVEETTTPPLLEQEIK